MKVKNLFYGVIALSLSCVALSLPVRAGTIDLRTSGTLGPLISGIDPLKLNGGAFLLTGTIDENSAPISMTADSATYNIPGTLDITVGALDFSGFFGTMTLIDPSSGRDTVVLDFMVSELGFVPVVSATLSLPEGTLNGTGLQNYSGNLSQPDSTFSYQLIGGSSHLDGELGVSGFTSASGGTSPSGVPEPGTIGLLAGGLLAVTLLRRNRKPIR